MSVTFLDCSKVADRLRRAVGNSPREWAEAHGMSEQQVRDVLRGKRSPGHKVAAALGLEKVVVWRRKEGR